MLARGIRLTTLLALAAAAVFVLWRVYAFGQERFFTIDEWQYGHATWLVAEGQRPYLDFYEHHFPLSYAAHAPFVGGDESFSHKALLLRRIPFVYMLAMAVAVAFGTAVATRNAFAAVLAGFLPLAFGFGLMSAVDYRADNFGAFLWLACLALLEANRKLESRALSAGCGVLFACALLTTQKMLAVAGGAALVFLLADRLRGGEGRLPLLARPVHFLGTTAAILAAALAAGAATGVLSAGFDATILDAIRHEAHYPSDPVWRFAAPFFAATAWTTLPLLAFAALFFAALRSGFWLVPVAVAAAAGLAVAGQYPYNYVFLCLSIGVCAVRGFAAMVERLPAGVGAWRPLLYLLPLALLPDQLGFVAGRTTNEHQLRVLEKIERNTAADDVVIDGAGGALFRPHASYHWYHGLAHREMYADYFANGLIDDYRKSAAPLWIEDLRLYELPKPVADYFRRHYVPADGSLFALGFATPETAGERRHVDVEILRAGTYHLVPLGRGTRTGGLAVDGVPVTGDRVELSAGQHRVTVQPDTRRHIVSLYPREFFVENVSGGKEHSLLFEYD